MGEHGPSTEDAAARGVQGSCVGEEDPSRRQIVQMGHQMLIHEEHVEVVML